jgi:GMP synthase (glutamine-hydrolysing)
LPGQIVAIQHAERATLDRFADWLDGVTVEFVCPYAGDPVPETVPCALIILGGPMSADDDQLAPWLPEVRALVARTVAEGKPTLGICLGCQLLALACGGAVQNWAEPGWESGVIDVRWREEARSDPLVSGLPDPCPGPSMHRDAVTRLPPDSVWLASSATYPYQAFRVGAAAWGFQFHPEASAARVESWAGYRADIEAADLLAQFTARDDEIVAAGMELAQRFSAIVSDFAHSRQALL